MNIYAILTRTLAAEVPQALRGAGHEVTVRAVESGQGPALLTEAARVPADVLVLDAGAGPGLGPAAIGYRIARPEARVVLLAPGRQPGDPEVAAVVAAGAYDVAIDPAGLADLLERPAATIAAAAMWLDPNLAPKAASGAEQVRERVIERRVATSARPVVIACAGVADGVGTTTLAAAIGAYLARAGYRTVLVEAHGRDALGIVAGIGPRLDGERAQAAEWVPGLHLVPEGGPDDVREAVRARRWEYVVADWGVVPRAGLPALDADMTVIVAPAAPSRWGRLTDWLRAEPHDPLPAGACYVAFGPAAPPELRQWVEVSAQDAGAVADGGGVITMPVVAGPNDWPPGYRRADQALDADLAALLAPVLPDQPRRPKRRLWPFRRARGREVVGGGGGAAVATAAVAAAGQAAQAVGQVAAAGVTAAGGVARGAGSVVTAAIGLLEVALYLAVPVALIALVVWVVAPQAFAGLLARVGQLLR